MLEGESASAAVLDALRDGTDDGTDAGSESDGGDRAGALTDQLLADSETVCWTCCSAVERERIEATLDRLRGVRSDLLEERRTITWGDRRPRKREERNRNPTVTTRAQGTRTSRRRSGDRRPQ